MKTRHRRVMMDVPAALYLRTKYTLDVLVGLVFHNYF
jgi:hypothetical protein